jgi:hypothetical protein
MGIIYEQSKHIAPWIWISVEMNKNKLRSFWLRSLYNALGHKLRFPQGKKAQVVTVMGIAIQFL